MVENTASTAVNEIRVGNQSQDRECARPHRAAFAGRPCRRDDRMKRATLTAFTENGVFTAMIGLMLIVLIGLMLIPFLSSPLNAEQPPPNGCLAVSKSEYDSARRQRLLHTRFTAYVR